MRYAIVSDIHANAQAWSAVCADIQMHAVDKIISTGDVVGYGPAPAEVLRSVYSRIHYFTLGNHDAVIAGSLTSAYFNERARYAAEWTEHNLEGTAATFFQQFPLILTGKNFVCAHGNPAEPENFDYIFDAEDAASAFRATEAPLIFIGHSHVPGLFIQGKSGNIHSLKPQDFGTEAEKRYIVNVGSVGLPRDGDPRACYVIYDEPSGDIFFRRLPFDIQQYIHDLRANELPEEIAECLHAGVQHTPAPVRELVDFTPRQSADSSASEHIQSRDIDHLSKRIDHWRKIALLSVIFLVCALITTASVWHLRLEAESPTVHEATDNAPLKMAGVGTNMLPAPTPISSVTAEHPLKRWKTVTNDPSNQDLQVLKGKEVPYIFQIRSTETAELQLISPPLQAPANCRFRVKAQFKRLTPVKGYLRVALLSELSDGTLKTLGFDEPNNFGEEKQWRRASFTLGSPLDSATKLRFAIQTKMAGKVQVRKCRFMRRE